MKVLWVETPGTTWWSNMSIEITSQDNRAMRMSVNHLLNVISVGESVVGHENER